MSHLDSEYREGRKLIDECIRKRGHLSSFDLFRACWTLIEENREKFTGRAMLANYPESAWRVLVYNDFIRYFAKLRPEFVPPARSLTAPAGSAIVVTIHTGLELGIANALSAKGKSVSVIYVPAPLNMDKAKLFRPFGRIQFIKADRDCLFSAHMVLRSGGVVLADCDHPLPENPSANAVRAISRGLFEFAKRTRTELCFVLPFVDRKGHIDFLHKSMGVPPRGNQDDRPKFVEFLGSAGMGWMRWELP
jgi:hypothetical protein